MSKKYHDLTKEELERLLEERDRRDATRFGLVWETNEIERDKALNSDFIALDLVPDLSEGQAPWQNLIIEGENFDALRYLRMTHAGRVKCILIDPPYNTGAKDFVYNDHFVDEKDSWRSSTWIDFLYHRLVIARDLLKEDGVMLVCINDENRAKLELLLDKVMPGRRVGSFVWRTRSGANDSKEYFRSVDHEYVLCYANPDFTFAGKKKTNEAYSNSDNDPRGPWNNDNLVKAHNYKQRPNTFYPIQNPETGVWYACDPDNVWRFSSERRLKVGQKIRSKTMEQIIREEKVLWPKDETTVCYSTKGKLLAAIRAGTAPRNLRIGNTNDEKLFWSKELTFWVGKTIGYGKPRYKRHLSELKRTEKPFSSWLVPASVNRQDREALKAEETSVAVVGGTSDGTSLLQEILGNKEFDYPKPLSLVQAFVRQTTSDGDLILDFFAGSGTTAHAALAQNEEDEGQRKFILVSNREANKDQPNKNVCLDVCAQRMRRVIRGYNAPLRSGTKEVPGLTGDFAYLRTRRIAPGDLVEIDHSQIWTALQLMHRESLEAFTEAPFVWSGDEEQGILYVPRFRRRDTAAICKQVKQSAGVILYSWQPEMLRQHVRTQHVQHEAIPESLARKFGFKS